MVHKRFIARSLPTKLGELRTTLIQMQGAVQKRDSLALRRFILLPRYVICVKVIFRCAKTIIVAKLLVWVDAGLTNTPVDVKNIVKNRPIQQQIII